MKLISITHFIVGALEMCGGVSNEGEEMSLLHKPIDG
jgi:hypothetical protein